VTPLGSCPWRGGSFSYRRRGLKMDNIVAGKNSRCCIWNKSFQKSDGVLGCQVFTVCRDVWCHCKHLTPSPTHPQDNQNIIFWNKIIFFPQQYWKKTSVFQHFFWFFSIFLTPKFRPSHQFVPFLIESHDINPLDSTVSEISGMFFKRVCGSQTHTHKHMFFPRSSSDMNPL